MEFNEYYTDEEREKNNIDGSKVGRTAASTTTRFAGLPSVGRRKDVPVHP